MTIHKTEYDPPKGGDRYKRVLCWDAWDSIWVFGPEDVVMDNAGRYCFWADYPADPTT